jgi:type I restriction-modification system DNA methylase subunit
MSQMLFKGKSLIHVVGGDSQHEMSYPAALKSLGILENNITTIDIREDSLADIKGDYLKLIPSLKYDCVITNPPFNIAKEIIEKALTEVKDGGFVIMLLRLNFFGGKLRKDMWDKQLPKYAFVHNRRISFTEHGGTDSIEYMHCVWQKGYYPSFTSLKVI